jgi:hypothetical protein
LVLTTEREEIMVKKAAFVNASTTC